MGESAELSVLCHLLTKSDINPKNGETRETLKPRPWYGMTDKLRGAQASLKHYFAYKDTLNQAQSVTY